MSVRNGKLYRPRTQLCLALSLMSAVGCAAGQTDPSDQLDSANGSEYRSELGIGAGSGSSVQTDGSRRRNEQESVVGAESSQGHVAHSL